MTVSLRQAGYRLGERIHRNPRHTLHRAYSVCDQQKSIIVKASVGNPVSADVALALRHEFELLQGIEEPHLIRAIDLQEFTGGLALLLQDAGPYNLQQKLDDTPLSLTAFFSLAPQLVASVDALSRHRLIHRDLNPANFVLDATSRYLTLIDFEMGTGLESLSARSEDLLDTVGTLPYISPEQTGRTGHRVDYRTDLYSLGATLYHMLTGKPPFGEEHSLDLVYSHLAQRPVPPHELNGEVPELLSALCLKLLEKDPEARYQTTRVLREDLAEIAAQWRDKREVAVFPLGRGDVRETIYLSDKLYGRKAELNQLKRVFAEACSGSTKLVLIKGPAGIGKSSLVEHLQPEVLTRHGYFLSSKFDPLQRAQPFACLIEALDGLGRQLLMMPEANLDRWRRQLTAAIGANGRLLTELIPSLEAILGHQPPVPALPPAQARNRFTEVLLAFVQACATADHPLLLFLDDLQWADTESLRLLERILLELDVAALSVVAAYRDSDAGATDAFASALKTLEEADVVDCRIELARLTKADVSELLHEALGRPLSTVRHLGEILRFKSGGNPLVLRQLLQELTEKGVIWFDRKQKRWEWELATVAAQSLTQAGAETLLPAIRRLPRETQRLLSLAACIGDRAELSLIAACVGQPATETARQLWPALRLGLLRPLGQAYRVSLHGKAGELGDVSAAYRFAHDRIREATYEQLPVRERPLMHLTIGRLLWQQNDQEALFKAADHLNQARAAIAGSEERLRLAELNLRVGRAAKAATAYEHASAYFAAGLQCLPAGDRAWIEYRDVMFALSRECAECANLTGDPMLAERFSVTALAHTQERTQRTELGNVRIVAATLAGEYSKALELGAELLLAYGIRLSRDAIQQATRAQIEKVTQLLENRTSETVLSAEAEAPPEIREASEVLANLGAPAFISGGELTGIISGKIVELTLRYGHSQYSGEGFVGFATIYGSITGDYAGAYEQGELGIKLARRYASPPQLCRALCIFGNHVNHWRKPLATNIPLLQEAVRVGVEAGELQFAAYAKMGQLLARVSMGSSLKRLRRDAEECRRLARKAGNKAVLTVQEGVLRHVQVLQGAAELGAVSAERQAGNETDISGSYTIDVLALQCAVILGDYPSARAAAMAATERLSHIIGLIPLADFHFYAGLAITGSCRKRNQAAARSAIEKVDTHLQALADYARGCPENFYHRRLLLEAELARLKGQAWQAVRGYVKAAERARAQESIADYAIANEFAGQFFCEHEQWRYASVHLQAAYEGYRQWGATAKSQQLETVYSQLLEPLAGDAASTTRTGITISRDVDIAGLLKASQALSEQLALPDLLQTLLQIIFKIAGAERAYLLLEHEDGLRLRAYGPGREGEVTLTEEPVRLRTDLPQRVLEFVRRSNEAVVLTDARRSELFADDPVVRERRIRSVLCVPVSRQGKLVGVLYLENNITSYAFTQARLEPIKHLTAQLAISLENSALVEALERNQELYSTLAKNFPHGGVFLFDRDCRFMLAEGRALIYAGLDSGGMKGRLPEELFAPDVSKRLTGLFKVALEGEEANSEIAVGERIYQMHALPIRDAEGQVALGMALSQDITQRKQDEEQLRLAAKVFESSTEAIAITDAKRRTVLVNRAFRELTGYTPDEVIGRDSELLKLEDDSLKDWLRSERHRQGLWQGEAVGWRKSGERFPIWLTLNAVRDRHERLTHYVAIASDLSERKAAEERIRFLAYYDPLTRLPNRALLRERLQLALAMAERNQQRVAVLFLDLDRFKYVNDSLGHAAGDRLLQAVTKRLQGQIRSEDTMSRPGGDEFIVVLPEIREPADAVHAAEKIQRAFRHPFLLEGHDIRLSTSIGISLYPEDGDNPDALIKHADAAMYHAKRRGRKSHQFFTEDLNTQAYERLFIEGALRHALQREELALYYQPQVDALTGRIVGAEALMRWHHPERGLMLPGRFIPLAEETGQIVELGEWALRTACRQNRAWQQAGLPPITVAVNLAAEHFRRPGFTQSVIGILRQSELTSRWLEIELTERTVMEDVEATASTLQTLKKEGLSFSIDDFGTGYSSLAYLKRFPIDKLKIDQSFIRDIVDDPDDATITRSIIRLGHSLRLQVIAEGVESADHEAFCRRSIATPCKGITSRARYRRMSLRICLPVQADH
ncbi:EAL domain-containing protein [Alkalilimnicola ehrlichii]|uniref:EAL domain-containing protein n=1 Tax=Alkalilimnicola ehrlichii TaxID=351052 RepID=UPI0015F27410|nr:EAL domain-containing protein [Alkalilimnicola ehrlichii]